MEGCFECNIQHEIKLTNSFVKQERRESSTLILFPLNIYLPAHFFFLWKRLLLVSQQHASNTPSFPLLEFTQPSPACKAVNYYREYFITVQMKSGVFIS